MARRPDRWPARPLLGALLRCAIVIVPLSLALVVAVVLTQTLPAAAAWPGRLAWWAAVLGGSTAALVLADLVARRTLPLAVLLDLSLVFPGRAPSRLRAARSTSVRELERRLTTLRSEGAAGRPIDAAETLVTLVGILGLHDRRTRGHSERVRSFTDLLTEELGLDEDARVRVRWAALVHDIGKLSVPGSVLNGGRDLSDDHWAALRRHPDEGRRLAAGLLPWLGEWGTAVDQHHERWDGEGYPRGLSGEQIGYGARIVAVADAFDTMTAARSYSRARTAAAAREELARCAGTQFDPQVVRAFLALSLPRLSWVLGPVTWVAQLPFLVAADRAARAIKGGATATGVAGLVVVGALHGPGADIGSNGPAVAAGVARSGNPTGTGPSSTGRPATAGPGTPQALPFVVTDPTAAPSAASATPAARTPVPDTTGPAATPVLTPDPAPAPSPAPVASRPVPGPRSPASAPTPPVPALGTPTPTPTRTPTPTPVPARPPVATPTPTPTPTASPSPGKPKPKPKKAKNAGHGNGHFGQNNAGHSDRWAR
jgi:hypothetical protein